MAQSFMEFLQEDATTDVAKLQADIATIDAAIQQKTAPLTNQRNRLQKLLTVRMKQKEQEDKQKSQQQGQQPQQPQQQQMVAPGNATPTQ